METKPVEASSPFDDGELYDVLLQDFPYAVDFYVGLAREAKGPILDVACGTGRILLPCLQAGAVGDGLDLYQPMLDRLRTKAAALNLAPHLYRGDMSDFRLPRRYALVMITFNAFCHSLTQEAQVSCLKCCREHLLPGGLFVFDGFFPSLEYMSQPDNTRVLEGETRDPRSGATLRMYDTRSFDRVEQIQRSVNEIESVGADGAVKIIHRSEFRTRWVYKAEMALLMRVAGFARWEITGGFDRRPLTRETDGMVVFGWADGQA